MKLYRVVALTTSPHGESRILRYTVCAENLIHAAQRIAPRLEAWQTDRINMGFGSPQIEEITLLSEDGVIAV